MVAVAREHDHATVGQARRVLVDRRDRLQSALLARHDQHRHADLRQLCVELHVDARRRRGERGAQACPPHQLVGPPGDLLGRRRAAEPRPHGLGRPRAHALSPDEICVATPGAAHRRAEQRQRMKPMPVFGRECDASRPAVFGAHQVALRDAQRVEEVADIGRELADAPAVALRRRRGAEARQVGPYHPVARRQPRHPGEPRARGFRIAVDHHHALRHAPRRAEPVVLIGERDARPDLDGVHATEMSLRAQRSNPGARVCRAIARSFTSPRREVSDANVTHDPSCPGIHVLRHQQETRRRAGHGPAKRCHSSNGDARP